LACAVFNTAPTVRCSRIVTEATRTREGLECRSYIWSSRRSRLLADAGEGHLYKGLFFYTAGTVADGAACPHRLPRYDQQLMRIPQSATFRYGIAIVFVAAALGLSLLVHPFLPDGFLIFFLSAVMLAGWFGRTGAGLFAVVLSMLIVDYYFILPY